MFRKLKIVAVCIGAVCAMLPCHANAGSVNIHLKFSPADIASERSEGYDVIRMAGTSGAVEPGNPDLPRMLEYVLIPATAEIEKVEIIDRNCVEIAGTFCVMPAQEPCPISRPDLRRWTAPDAAVYSSSALFPEVTLTTSHSGSACGFRIAGFTYSPLQYLPSEGRLFLTTSATVTVHYREGIYGSKTISGRQYRAIIPLVRGIISNTQDLQRFSPQVRPDNSTDVNYAIVTDDAFKSGFDSFKLWKTKKGFRTEVFATSWIYSNYTGYDNAEKVRNFFKDYHKNKGLVYALLAGDVDKVPHRTIISLLNPKNVATDYYFADLDSTWDSNNDHVYAQVHVDVIDGYFDIFVGRVCIDNTEQAGNFVHKDTTMEKHPPTASLKKFLLPSANLIENVKHGKDINNILADTSTAGWIDAKLEDPTRYATRDSINKGFYLAHIASHGNWHGFYHIDSSVIIANVDTGSFTAADNTFSLFHSIACYVGEFDNADHDCISELLVNRKNGGLVCAITNSRYGYMAGATGEYKLTELLAFNYTSMLFKRDTLTIGQALAATMHLYREDIWKKDPDFMMTYCATEWNLLGDPDLPFYKEVPTQLSATYPGSINAGQQNITVTVGARAPVAGALVCCYKDGQVHETGYTNASGQVGISINPTTNGVMYVTATAQNRLPYEGVCTVGPSSIDQGSWQPAGATRIMQIKPDRSGTAEIRYVVSNASKVHAVLYNARGKALKNIYTDVTGPGIHTLYCRGLYPGVYLFSFSAGEYTAKEKFIMVK